MKEKYGVFLFSEQPTGYGKMYVLAQANNATYKTEYHAQDAMKAIQSINNNSPFNRFYGNTTTVNYTVLPIYEQQQQLQFFQFGNQQQQESQSQYLTKIDYGVFRMDNKIRTHLDLSGSINLNSIVSGSQNSGSVWVDMDTWNTYPNNTSTLSASFELTQLVKFPSMSIALDYVKNIPNNILKQGQNDFVVLPIYRYNKP